jgi:hypothetical protein
VILAKDYKIKRALETNTANGKKKCMKLEVYKTDPESL